MTDNDGATVDRSTRMAELRADFVQQFEKPRSPRRQLLVAPPGAGKTSTAIEVIAHRASIFRNNRVLAVLPEDLTAQFAYRCRRAQPVTPVELVDSARFRELESETRAGVPRWPTSIIAVFSHEQLSRPEVAEGVLQTRWDLLLVDEVQDLNGRAATVVGKLVKTERTGHCLLLASAPIQTTNLPGGLRVSLAKGLKVTDWSVVASTWGQGDRHELPIGLSAEEHNVLEQLRDLTDLLGPGKIGRAERRVLLMCANSSFYALEEAVRSLRQQLVSPKPRIVTPEGQVEGERLRVRQPLDISFRGSDRKRALGLIDRILDALDELPVDTKLTTTAELVLKILGEEKWWRIIVFTSFGHTASYLESSLAELGIEVGKLTQSMLPEDSAVAVERFLTNGGVLVVTDAAIKGVQFGTARAAIHYDQPDSDAGLAVRMSRAAFVTQYFLLQDGSEEVELATTSGANASRSGTSSVEAPRFEGLRLVPDRLV